jgi:hypothetical protein
VTKAQRILELYEQAVGTMPERKIPKFIAAQVGTSDSYVRTVARQRLGRGHSEADLRYKLSPLGRKTSSTNVRKRYWSDPAYRENKLKKCIERYYRAKRLAEARAS